jgi:sugar/nucleoside kinase (ribokinase family)
VAVYEVGKLENELMVDINGAGDSFVGGFVSKLIVGPFVDLPVALHLSFLPV